MRTDELIAHLSADLRPIRGGAVARVLVAGAAMGLAASSLVMLLVLHPRHDFAAAMASFGMWMKLAYAFAIAGFGLWIVERAGRPGASALRPAIFLALPFAAITVLAALQLAAPGADIPRLILGQSSQVCAVLVAMVALPTLAATFWALRQLAPTRLTLAGAGAGLFAGGAGAFVYAFHCPEMAAPFVAIWYTLGIALTTVIGAFLGRWALRW